MALNSYKKVGQVLWVVLFANLGVAALKLFIGALMSSASISADGFHSLTDATSNIVGLIGIQLAAKPVDEDHPYGHGKFETLAGLFIAGMLFFIGGKVIFEAIQRLINPVVPTITTENLIILIVTFIINIGVYFCEYTRGKQLNSQILISDSMHTRSDIYISLGVIVALLGMKLGMPSVLDPIASLIVSVFILHAACEVFKDNSNILVDKAAVDTEQVKLIVLSFEQVKDAHKIRSRGCANELYIDLHIMTEPNMSVQESHTLIHDIEAQIQQEMNKNIQVIAHLEPYNIN